MTNLAIIAGTSRKKTESKKEEASSKEQVAERKEREANNRGLEAGTKIARRPSVEGSRQQEKAENRDSSQE